MFTKTRIMKISIINGPNLNLLGKREPAVYGSQTFEEYFTSLQIKFPTIEFSYFQSNVEGELIDKIQKFGFSFDGIILNAGAYTHTSRDWRCCQSNNHSSCWSPHFEYIFPWKFQTSILYFRQCQRRYFGFWIKELRISNSVFFIVLKL